MLQDKNLPKIMRYCLRNMNQIAQSATSPTTRQCWTYYTETTTPLFTVFAHGMAAVAVWRVIEIMQRFMLCNNVGKQTASARQMSDETCVDQRA